MKHEMPPDEVSAARRQRGGEREHCGQCQTVVQTGLEVERVADHARDARIGHDSGGENRVGGRKQRPEQERLGPVQADEPVGQQRERSAR